MKQQSYNKEIKFATAQILDIFNNILIDRRTSDRVIQKQFMVPCVYGARSRIMMAQENKNYTLKPPLMSLVITNFTKERERVHSVNDGLFFNLVNNTSIKNNMAIPVTITYELSIMTKFQDDMDQIVSNFMALMNPDVYVVWPAPYSLGNIKSQIIFNDSISFTYPNNIPETSPWRILATTNFNFKTWIFPGKGTRNESVSGNVIKKINLNDNTLENKGLTRFYSVPSYMSFDDYIENLSAGIIQPVPENSDKIQVLNTIISSYWIDMVGELSGVTYNPKDKDDLPTLINNVYNDNLQIYSLSGNIPLNEEIFTRDILQDIWVRMLSGDLSSTFPISG